MTTDETLNELLVRLFKDIMEIEARCLVNEEFKDISYNDFHIIEAIGLKEPKSMTAVAKLMDVTTGTLTKAMDGLTEKGYAVRERSKQDKRVVWVYLTDKGKAAYAHHEEFHRKMIANIKGQLNEQETPILIYTLAKLVDYFKRNTDWRRNRHMSRGALGKNNWALFLMLLAGIMLGGFIGNAAAGVSGLSWLNYGQSFGFASPIVLDLGILVITFGLSIKITIASIIGVLIAIIIYRLI